MAILARRTGQNQCGVKPNPSLLLLLPKFDIVRDFPVDYMHAVCEGVVDKLSLWFESSYNQQPWYIGRRIREMDERIVGIVPPSEVTRLPASPSKRAYCKASEFRCWLLFYCLPIFNGILATPYLKHLVLLIQSIWLLNQTKISVPDIGKAYSLLTTFVRKMEQLYGAEHMSFNNHILLHLPNTVLNWGPLWASSCFLFEGYNRTLKSLFHGTARSCSSNSEQFCNSTGSN
ncbi:hypothetical protein HOLleu_03062 [Holothuria leucospilota]|uniref:Uncharacterized protein n=1 Tax=Holothuria leucospilota TaxID=206669 RepID=A0A9Q1CT01_HOLLE|nr:hypothetical protein HOLleu_03062 [Holothuria leucospilota]